MRVATWNVNSLRARRPRVLDWLATRQPDVVCLQETKVDDAEVEADLDAYAELGYAVAHHGDGRWNGVAVLSRAGLADVERGFAGEPAFDEQQGAFEPGTAPGDDTDGGLFSTPSPGAQPQRRCVQATCGGLRVVSVYVPNGREVDAPHYRYKLAWLAALREALARQVRPDGPPLLLAGDYNVARTDADVWDPSLFATSTHVTPPERAAVDALEGLGLVDVTRRRWPDARVFTYWDYRQGAFHKDLGMRIDLALLTGGEADRVVEVFVDREARKGKGPSDHAPLVVDLDEPGVPVAGVLPVEARG